jgi:hypothetical protein
LYFCSGGPRLLVCRCSQFSCHGCHRHFVPKAPRGRDAGDARQFTEINFTLASSSGSGRAMDTFWAFGFGSPGEQRVKVRVIATPPAARGNTPSLSPFTHQSPNSPPGVLHAAGCLFASPLGPIGLFRLAEESEGGLSMTRC